MSFLLIDPSKEKEYEYFVNNHSSSTIFHSSEWFTLLSKTYGFKISTIVFYDSNKIIGIIPIAEVLTLTRKKKIVSLPFSDFCEPLFCGDFSLSSFFHTLKEQAVLKGWKSFEMRGGGKFLRGITPFTTIFTHDIDLTKDKEVIFRSFKSSLQRNIRNAQKNELKLLFSTSLEDLKIFYSHNCLTRREHGLPPQPWKFFLNLYEYLLKKDKGFISIVKFREKPVASAVFLIYKNKAYYKYGASIKKYQKLRINDIMMWESLLKCKEIGCHTLNLGRTEKEHHGLLRFKRGFNGLESELPYFLFSFVSDCFIREEKKEKKRLFYLIFSRMPIFMLKTIGKLIYKFVG